jgi:TrmH family RNA methyltransferase
MITSLQNPRIKEIRLLNSGSKHRRKAGLFVAEGVRLLEEALGAGSIPELVIYTEDLDQRGKLVVDSFQALPAPCELVSPEVLQSASDTETPQGILAVLPILSPALPPHPDLIVILDAIRDPGNLGTLMRSCLAAGADGMLLGPGTVDPYSPKVVRAGMGAHFKLPVQRTSWKGISRLTKNLNLYLAEMEGGQCLWDLDLSEPLGIILGGEAHGAGQKAHQLSDQQLHIPMDSDSDSLNAAVAGAVILFEIKRQRIHAGE